MDAFGDSFEQQRLPLLLPIYNATSAKAEQVCKGQRRLLALRLGSGVVLTCGFSMMCSSNVRESDGGGRLHRYTGWVFAVKSGWQV